MLKVLLKIFFKKPSKVDQEKKIKVSKKNHILRKRGEINENNKTVVK